VLAGTTPSALAPVGSYPAQGFETSIAAPDTARYVSVEALSASGAVVAKSAVANG
jgi:hypothetical protein